VKIILVYQADSGFRSALIDGLHKVVSPNTYACHLCKLTHGAFTERKNWKSFLGRTSLDFEMLHRDEFKTFHDVESDFPAIFQFIEGSVKKLLGPEEIQKFKTELDLIEYFEKLESSFA
jgi:hypothetical protein